MRNKKNIKTILIVILIIAAIIALITLLIINNKKISQLTTENKNLKNNVIELNNTIEEYKSEIGSYNNNTFPYGNKNCTYTDTYEFIDYFEYEGFIENQFYIILDKYMTKEDPLILMLDKDEFKKDFIKGQSYEITFNKLITYDEDTGVLIERTNVIKIEPTDKKGMEQTAESCILD